MNSAYGELFSPDNGAAQNAQYDALNRLIGFARGTLSASHGTGTPLDTVSSPSATEGWTLDALGNWTSFTNGSTTQTRSFNARNEITSISGVSTPTYDANGNMVIDPSGDKYFYNEWNQITKVENSSGTLLESYEYDALGRRIAITNASTGVTTDLYYDGNQVIEERQGGTVTAQYVWGLGYTNDLVLRDDNSTTGSLGVSGSGLGRRIYVEQDGNFSVTSLTDTSGNVLERFSYDPYGNMIVLTGTTTWTTTTDSFNWVYTWQGGRLDQVTGFIRFDAGGDGRDVDTALGVPMEQDPDGYGNGANLYQWEVSNPETYVDPTGDKAYQDPTDPYGNYAPGGLLNQNPVYGHGTVENPDGVANWNNNVNYYKGLGNQALQNQLNNLRDLALAMARQLADQAIDSVNPLGMFGFSLSQWAPIKNWLDKHIPCPTNPYANKAAPWVLFALTAMVGDAAGGLGAAGEGEAAASEAKAAASEGEAAGNAGNYDKLVKKAQEAYPKKAGTEELHHVEPKYLGGAADGPTVPLDGAYHQQITNDFRRIAPYGQDYDGLSAAERLRVMNQVYSKYPLPPGTKYP